MRGLDSRTGLLTALTIAVALLTVVLSMAFAQAQQTMRVSDAADRRQQATDAATIISLTRSQAESALLFTAADIAGVAEPGQRDAAISALASTADVFGGSRNPLLAGARAAVSEDLSEIVTMLEEDDVAAARLFIDERLSPDLDVLQAAAAGERRAADEIIAVETGTAGRWGLITSFGVAVIVPAVALIAFRSIVNRRRRQQELEQRLQHESELNAAKDEMISNLSHELRTPLTGIYGFALAMEESGPGDPLMQAELTNLIIHEAADLSRMVDDLLTAAKADGDGLHFTTEDVDVAREIREAVLPFVRSGHSISADVEPGVVIGDRLRLRQILRNLVSNATNHGGPTIEIVGRRDGDIYRFEICDDGPGVPEHVAERLFQRFVHEGSEPLLTGSIGLGLSIVRLLAAGMEGTVRYEREDSTSRFIVELPAADRPGTELEPLVAPSPVRSAGARPSHGPSPTRRLTPPPPPVPART